jgi:hypothetical protein
MEPTRWIVCETRTLHDVMGPSVLVLLREVFELLHGVVPGLLVDSSMRA